MVRRVQATRYVTPLREGGSVPAIVEADDDGLYVVKFRGAAQGARALIAEIVGGEIGRALGLPVPEIVLIDLDAAIGQNEPDPEIRELVVGSAGVNVGIDFLPGSFGLTAGGSRPFAPDRAARVVWFDAFITNVDRTLKNPNILLWHREPWLIDHGAALYFHHTWENWEERALTTFPMIREHVLLPSADAVATAGDACAAALGPSLFSEIVALIPDGWLTETPLGSPADVRSAYVRYLERRLAGRQGFEAEADRARA